tara:strand:- start:12737 stop:14674 length:1938 start_codon:yes stop_codon:yes gene_type:complete
MYLALLLVLACGHPKPAQVPGSTLRAVESVVIRPMEGSKSDFNWKVLLGKLGHRPGNFIIPPRDYNPYRLGEDRRRIATYASNYGYFDVEVSEPDVRDKGAKVAIDWRVKMGPQYRIASLQVIGVPHEARAAVMDAIPFREGSEPAVNEHRILRHVLADKVRWYGYGHARVYSRAWVDRKKKSVAWYYFVDPGPKTSIASITVRGNARVPQEDILRRSGLQVGDAYGPQERDRAQLAIMDAAQMVSVVVDADEDVHKGPPQVPDSGGEPITNADGSLAKRTLEAGLHVTVSVVEAPRRALRLEVGMEADPSRTDAYAGGRLVFRDIATSGLHVVTEGRLGYGYELGTSNEPLGLYGYALGQVVRTGAFGSRFDVRATALIDHRLLPDTAVREYSAGPGLRRTLVDNLHLDMEVLGYRALEVDPLPLSAAERANVNLSEDSTSSGVKLLAALVHDVRDSGIEATDGHFLSARAEFAPDTLGATHQWLRLSGDARLFVPVAPFWTVAARVSGSWVGLATDSGLPLQSRLFGGGSYGFRGTGRQTFATQSEGLYVGGTSLLESSLELRHLPFQQLYGLIAFLDVGAVASENNPFADGVSSAVGIGGRARPFYIPIAVDVSYRYLDESALRSPIDGGVWSVFLRLGEAF